MDCFPPKKHRPAPGRNEIVGEKNRRRIIPQGGEGGCALVHPTTMQLDRPLRAAAAMTWPVKEGRWSKSREEKRKKKKKKDVSSMDGGVVGRCQLGSISLQL